MQLIRRSELARRFGMTPVGFSKMAARSAGFPAPIKTGDNRQSAVFYDAAEVEACGILQGLGNCHGESATNSQTSG